MIQQMYTETESLEMLTSYIAGFTEKPTDKCSVSVSVFWGGGVKRPKPTDIFGEKSKNGPRHFHSRP